MQGSRVRLSIWALFGLGNGVIYFFLFVNILWMRIIINFNGFMYGFCQFKCVNCTRDLRKGSFISPKH
jgi:hypothetical protein